MADAVKPRMECLQNALYTRQLRNRKVAMSGPLVAVTVKAHISV